MNEKLLQLVAEVTKRYAAKSPKFFNVITYISVTITVLLGLPAYLQDAGVVFPEAWDFFINKSIFYLGLGAGIVSKLTVENKEDLK